MEVKLSLFGFGNVGKTVARVLLEKEAFFRERYGVEFKVVSIATRAERCGSRRAST